MPKFVDCHEHGQFGIEDSRLKKIFVLIRFCHAGKRDSFLSEVSWPEL